MAQLASILASSLHRALKLASRAERPSTSVLMLYSDEPERQDTAGTLAGNDGVVVQYHSQLER